MISLCFWTKKRRVKGLYKEKELVEVIKIKKQFTFFKKI